MSTNIGAAGSSISSLWNNPQLLGAMLPGFNITALDQAMQSQLTVDAIPLTQVSQQVAQLKSQASAWQQIQTDLTNLENDAATLSGASLYQGISAVSSDPTAVSATPSGSGVPATFQVAVTSLMQPQIVESALQSSDTTALGYSGSFSINGTSIQVASGATLQDIADSINSAAAGVTATVLQPSADPGRYVLNMATTEGSNATWSDPNGILTGLGVLQASGSPSDQLQSAAEAQYTINGQAEQIVTNSDSTSIPGVTLDFLQPTGAAAATITTSQNQGQITGAFQKVASDYNALLSDLNKYAGVGGVLEGNAALLGISDTLQQTLGGSDPGQPVGFQSLPQVGVSISAPVGSPQALTMSVDTSTLEAALTSNPSAVASLMNSTSGIAQQLQQQLNTFVGPAGSISAQISGLNGQISTLSNEINDPNSALNQMVQQENQQMQAQFNDMLTALLQSQAQGQQIQGFLQAQSGSGSSNNSSSGGTGYGG